MGIIIRLEGMAIMMDDDTHAVSPADSASVETPAVRDEADGILLSPAEARVLGCLIEKSITTPEYYPLTLNALTAACNQKSNREPVMQLDDQSVRDATESLRYRHRLVYQVDSAGSRVMKYRHRIEDRLPHGPDQVAALCMLLLRGPQTAGELRTHTRRLHDFESPAAVERTLTGLEQMQPRALVKLLPREPGRRERRYTHLLCGDVEVEAATGDDDASFAPAPADGVRMQALEARIEALESEMAALREAFAGFRKQFE